MSNPGYTCSVESVVDLHCLLRHSQTTFYECIVFLVRRKTISQAQRENVKRARDAVAQRALSRVLHHPHERNRTRQETVAMKSQRSTRMTNRDEGRSDAIPAQSEMEQLLEQMEDYFDVLMDFEDELKTIAAGSTVLLIGDQSTLELPMEGLAALGAFSIVRDFSIQQHAQRLEQFGKECTIPKAKFVAFAGSEVERDALTNVTSRFKTGWKVNIANNEVDLQNALNTAPGVLSLSGKS